ncbi:preprotein translocase subunit SecA [Vigna unguiculata]|uniref:Preprotein translocase subunit SecA n=1 Tax=Vigna unguiculata TaxID=3917 RepID=A0A4D6N096_VIGUN|nr:preprotein translocase subunit SecA [Vigna unguiculata]
MQYAKKRMACLNQAFARSSLTVKEVRLWLKMKEERTWVGVINRIKKVNEKLFPCQLSNKNVNLTEKAVQLAVETWGKRSLTELEAEERLSYAGEKGPAQDEVIALPSSAMHFWKLEKNTKSSLRKKELWCSHWYTPPHYDNLLITWCNNPAREQTTQLF